MRKICVAIGLLLALVSFAGTGLSQDNAPVDGFWSSLMKLCGKAYEGKADVVPATDTIFKDKKLVIDVSSCQARKVKITFIVGDDRSRTLVFYQADERLLLKHEHRLKNGALDPITNYGGWTSNSGSTTKQVFPADEETAALLPEAAPNVWWIDIESGKSFTYNLQRLGTDRYYRLNFDLSKAVPVPKLLDN